MRGKMKPNLVNKPLLGRKLSALERQRKRAALVAGGAERKKVSQGDSREPNSLAEGAVAREDAGGETHEGQASVKEERGVEGQEEQEEEQDDKEEEDDDDSHEDVEEGDEGETFGPPFVLSGADVSESKARAQMNKLRRRMARSSGKATAAAALHAFEWLIGPMEVSQFYHSVWEKKPLLIQRPHCRDYYAGWFGKADVEVLLQQRKLRYGTNVDVTKYDDGQRFTFNGHGVAEADTVWQQFNEEGCSVRVLHPQRWSDNLWWLLSTLERHWNQIAGCNVYLTPSGSQGFSPHYDDIDAFVLQVEGSKRWRCYYGSSGKEDVASASDDDGDGEGEREEAADGMSMASCTNTVSSSSCMLARFSSGNYGPNDEIGTPVLDVVLQPGDLLYMPRGVIHQAEATATSHSLHLTISSGQKNTWADLLHLALPRAIELAAEEHVELRQSLPLDLFDFMGVTHSDEAEELRRRAFMSKVSACMASVLQSAPWDAAVDQHAVQFMRHRLPPAPSPPVLWALAGATAAGRDQLAVSGKDSRLAKPHKDHPVKLTEATCVQLTVEGGCRLVVEGEEAVVYHMLANTREEHNEGSDQQAGNQRSGRLDFPLEVAQWLENLLATLANGPSSVAGLIQSCLGTEVHEKGDQRTLMKLLQLLHSHAVISVLA